MTTRTKNLFVNREAELFLKSAAVFDTDSETLSGSGDAGERCSFCVYSCKRGCVCLCVHACVC